MCVTIHSITVSTDSVYLLILSYLDLNCLSSVSEIKANSPLTDIANILRYITIPLGNFIYLRFGAWQCTLPTLTIHRVNNPISHIQ